MVFEVAITAISAKRSAGLAFVPTEENVRDEVGSRGPGVLVSPDKEIDAHGESHFLKVGTIIERKSLLR